MIAAGLLYIGFFALAATMPRHAPALLGPWQRQMAPLPLRAIGWLAITLSLVCAILLEHGGIGLVSWCGLLPLMAGAVLLALTYDAGFARAALPVAALLVVAGAGFAAF